MSRYIRLVSQQIFERQFESRLESDDMEKVEILRTLISCGLSEYESKAYASLVFLGPAKAGVISRESKVPQSKIYDVLEQLMGKQLVEVFEGRPKEFKAVAPEVALRNLLEKKASEIEVLKARVDAISDYLKPAMSEEVSSGIWVIKGKKWTEFLNKTAEMFDRSRRYVYVVTRDFSRSAKLAEAVKSSMKRGVKVKIIGMEPVGGGNYYRARWYHEHGATIKVFKTKMHPRIMLSDGKEVLLRLDHNPVKRNRWRFNSLWSEDASLVKVMDSYVKNLWKSAEAVDFRKIPKPA